VWPGPPGAARFLALIEAIVGRTIRAAAVRVMIDNAPRGRRAQMGPHAEKRAACGCKRPKSREETPKEGGGNARRYRTATTYTATHKWQGEK
jgi:hypothetical protein